jgi:hypothetical protein
MAIVQGTALLLHLYAILGLPFLLLADYPVHIQGIQKCENFFNAVDVVVVPNTEYGIFMVT